MPKTKISEYSATANSNTDVASINIDEGCAPSGINNAIRAIMGHLKDFQSGTSNDPFTIGSSGSLTLSYGTANGVAYLNGSKAVTSGSALTFDGTNFATTGTASATKMIPTGGSATGNGMYLPASNTLAWSNNGSETMRLDSAGNLGLGVTPSAWASGQPVVQIGSGTAINSRSAVLSQFSSNQRWDGSSHRYLTTGAATLYTQNDGAHSWATAASGTAGNAITFTTAMALDASGNWMLGTTSQAGRATIKGSTSNGTTNVLKLVDSADADIMAMSTAGDFYLPKMGSSTGTTVVLTSGNYLVKSSSSIRYKKDVEPIDIGLNFILGLNPVKYKLKEDDIDQVGFIAEDFPDARLVSESMIDPQDKTKGFQREGVLYAQIVAPLVKAIQEQQALITQLTARITALESA